MTDFPAEVSAKQRFEFGINWIRFLNILNDDRIAVAKNSLSDMLEIDNLKGNSFLDIGSGSGLFSLSAKMLGSKVHSFDIDPQSVACTRELKRRYFPNDTEWTIEEGSVLDMKYLKSLGTFDIVYSWGVLHHTGSMWVALENACTLVAPGSRLFIAIYNDQGRASRYWCVVKKLYNRLPRGLKFLILWPSFIRLWGPTLVKDLVRANPFYTWKKYGGARGMAPWRDVVDWVGGYPFEVAKPEEIFDFCRYRGFQLTRLKTCAGGHGCNEFVFFKSSSDK